MDDEEAVLLRTYVGRVEVFNGRFVRKHAARVKASSFESAMGKALRVVVKQPKERVEGVTIFLQVLRGSAAQEEQEVRTAEVEEAAPVDSTIRSHSFRISSQLGASYL
jgi:hypothetical protein